MSTLTRKRINKKITRAIREFDLIQEGDKVLIGVSGGKDSLTLLRELALRRKVMSPRFDLESVCFLNDFSSADIPVEFLRKIHQEFDVPLRILDLPVKKRSSTDRKLGCYWCSIQRRAALLEEATQGSFDKVVLGHHLDDMIETIFMNMLYQGKLEPMQVKVDYDRFPFALIRPLVYVEEQEIIRYATEMGWQQITCQCDFSQNSIRKTVRQKIEELTKGNPNWKQSILQTALQALEWRPNQSPN